MRKIPTSVKDHISNANYYLEAANIVSHRTSAAVHILLLTAWENIKIAEEELHSWAQKIPTANGLYKSHAYKFRNIRRSKSIDRIVVGPPGTQPQTTSYSTGTDFEKLLYICRYGPKGGSKELASIFGKGWFPDDFHRSLISKIKWEEAAVKMFESLL